MRALILALFVGVLGGCPGEEPPAQDLGPDLTFTAHSDCGHSGDKGNSLGVGKFCKYISDCADNTEANLCTQLGDPDNYFCTMGCDKMGPANQCGENARCACDSAGRGCGCFPTACDNP